MKLSHKAPLAGALLGALALSLPSTAQACAGDGSQVIGTLCTVGFNWCPRQYAPADGQIQAISTNTALFSLIGCSYGGDCRTTFALPDLRGRVMIHSGQGPGLTPVQLSQRRGQEYITPNILQMAAHSHTATFVPTSGAKVEVSTGQAQTDTPTTGTYLATAYNSSAFSALPQWDDAPSGTVTLGGVSGGGGTVTLGVTGGSKKFPIVDPGLGVTACIALEGIFPSRS